MGGSSSGSALGDLAAANKEGMTPFKLNNLKRTLEYLEKNKPEEVD